MLVLYQLSSQIIFNLLHWLLYILLDMVMSLFFTFNFAII